MSLLSESVEREITQLVENIIRNSSTQLTEDEIKEIIQKLIPDLDQLISKKVKQHLVELAKFIINQFSEE